MLKLFKNKKDKPPKSSIISEPKENKQQTIESKCGKPLVLDNTRWEASIDTLSSIEHSKSTVAILNFNGKKIDWIWALD